MLPSTLPDFDAVALALQGADLEATLQELFSTIRGAPAVLDAERVWNDLLVRQAAGSVALDRDVGLPHARTGGVSRLMIAAGRHERGVAFDAKHQKVRLIFLVLTPKEQPAEYLQVVAMLAARLRKSEIRKGLLATETVEGFLTILKS